METHNHNLYKEYIIELYKNPLNKKEISDNKQITLQNPLCGDVLTCMIAIEDTIITQCTYTGTGCAISEAAASLLTDAVIGKTIDEVKKMTEHEVIELLGIPISYTRTKCATLLYRALTQRLALE